MRHLLAPLTRWLDRRIDARIAAAEARRQSLMRFANEVSRNLRTASNLSEPANDQEQALSTSMSEG